MGMHSFFLFDQHNNDKWNAMSIFSLPLQSLPHTGSLRLSLFLALIKARIAYECNDNKTKKDDSTRIQYLNDKFQN
jgi:hypothetical protein